VTLTVTDTWGASDTCYISIIVVEDMIDTDGDGIPDAQDPDDDNDCIPDDWELQYGLDPLNPSDAIEDTDSDGFTNLEEHQWSTDPTDSESYPLPDTLGNLDITTNSFTYDIGETVYIFLTNTGPSTLVGTPVLRIIDYTGNVVRTFAFNDVPLILFPADCITIEWDQTDDAGAQVNAGLYFAHGSIDNITASAEFIIVQSSEEMYEWLGLNESYDAELIEKGISELAIGASANIIQNTLEASYYLQGLNIAIMDVSDFKIEVRISADFEEGTVIVLNIDKETFEITADDQIEVRLDGELVALAEPSVVLAKTGENPLYFIGIGTSGVQLILYIPHFSERILTIEKLAERGIELSTKPSKLTESMIVVVAIGIAIVVAIVIYAKTKGGGRDGKYYEDYYIDRGNNQFYFRKEHQPSQAPAPPPPPPDWDKYYYERKVNVPALLR
jgi:hypothetical protein